MFNSFVASVRQRKEICVRAQDSNLRPFFTPCSVEKFKNANFKLRRGINKDISFSCGDRGTKKILDRITIECHRDCHRSSGVTLVSTY